MKVRLAPITHREPGWAQCGVCGTKFPHFGRTVGLFAEAVGQMTLCQTCYLDGPVKVARLLGASSSAFYSLASNAESMARRLAPLEQWPTNDSEEWPLLAFGHEPADPIRLLDNDVETLGKLDTVIAVAQAYATRAREVLGPQNSMTLAIDAHTAWLAQIHELTRKRVEKTIAIVQQAVTDSFDT